MKYQRQLHGGIVKAAFISIPVSPPQNIRQRGRSEKGLRVGRAARADKDRIAPPYAPQTLEVFFLLPTGVERQALGLEHR